jgi:hypothetical protein
MEEAAERRTEMRAKKCMVDEEERGKLDIICQVKDARSGKCESECRIHWGASGFILYREEVSPGDVRWPDIGCR